MIVRSLNFAPMCAAPNQDVAGPWRAMRRSFRRPKRPLLGASAGHRRPPRSYARGTAGAEERRRTRSTAGLVSNTQVGQELWQIAHPLHRNGVACPHGIGIGEKSEGRLAVIDLGSRWGRAHSAQPNRQEGKRVIVPAQRSVSPMRVGDLPFLPGGFHLPFGMGHLTPEDRAEPGFARLLGSVIAYAPVVLAGLCKPGGVRNVPATTFGSRTEN